jgi:2-keto-4-pentenoate hydratase
LKLNDPNASASTGNPALNVARAFVSARQKAAPLTAFPGNPPRDLAEAYAIQEAAIGLWPDEIAGWKVGLVAPAEQATLQDRRLAGPIFARGVVRTQPDMRVPLTAIPRGFAAIEVELVAAVGDDAPPGKTEWTLEEAAGLVREWHLGVEFAASPLATINDLGATVVICDFGNNSGLVVGSPLERALLADPGKLLCRAVIDGHQVGSASAASLPGGPLEALRFLAGHLASRGRPLRARQWVSTGAITGVHPVQPGQQAYVELIGTARIEVSIVAGVGARA